MRGTEERSFFLIQFVRADRQASERASAHQIRFLRSCSWRQRINFSNSLRKTNYVGIFRESLSLSFPTELFDTAVLSLYSGKPLPSSPGRYIPLFPPFPTDPSWLLQNGGKKGNLVEKRLARPLGHDWLFNVGRHRVPLCCGGVNEKEWKEGGGVDWLLAMAGVLMIMGLELRTLGYQKRIKLNEHMNIMHVFVVFYLSFFNGKRSGIDFPRCEGETPFN